MFDLALDDITRRADLFRPIWERTERVDGWVSLEVSPLLAYDPRSYVKALAAPLTVNTMPEKTLNALANHTELGRIMATDGGDCESILGEFGKAGVDVDALAARLQDEAAKSVVASWNSLMTVIGSKSAALK